MIWKPAIVSIALIGGLSMITNAMARDSREERAACQGDVRRLCDEFVPDEGEIAACLRAHFKQISPACRAVMTRR